MAEKFQPKDGEQVLSSAEYAELSQFDFTEVTKAIRTFDKSVPSRFVGLLRVRKFPREI